MSVIKFEMENYNY